MGQDPAAERGATAASWSHKWPLPLDVALVWPSRRLALGVAISWGAANHKAIGLSSAVTERAWANERRSRFSCASGLQGGRPWSTEAPGAPLLYECQCHLTGVPGKYAILGGMTFICCCRCQVLRAGPAAPAATETIDHVRLLPCDATHGPISYKYTSCSYTSYTLVHAWYRITESKRVGG